MSYNSRYINGPYAKPKNFIATPTVEIVKL